MATPHDEGYFELLDNGAGEMALLIPAKQGEPDAPKLLFNGVNTALLLRGNDFSVKLDAIVPAAGKALANVSTLLVTEIDENTESVVRTYSADVLVKQRLPI